MAQTLEEVNDHEAEVEACRLVKYKTSEGFKKGFARQGHNSFVFDYDLVISQASTIILISISIETLSTHIRSMVKLL